MGSSAMGRGAAAMRHRAIAVLIVTAVSAAAQQPARAFDDVLSAGDVSLDVDVLLEGRAVVGSTTKSWEDGGLGKVRYGADTGGDRRVLLRPEAAVIFTPRFGFDVTGKLVLTANDQQRQTIDVTEAFLEYKPAPARAFGFKARGGAFFPPISQENTGLAWTSPYTITSSAINSWVGEELKTIGVEATPYWRGDDLTVELTAAGYMANDPTGTLLAWRGWSFNDRETGFLDRLQLAQIRIIRPGGNLDTQAPTEKPFHEVDGSGGVYAGLSLAHADYGKLSFLWYDNLADDHAFVKSQWAWRTDFASLAYKVELPGDVDVLAQAMRGRTTVITIRAPIGPIVDTRFWSAYGLVSKEIGRHRLSFRGEVFKTIDRDTFPDNNNEHGFGLTAAYVFRPADNQRLTVEFLYVHSERPERAFLAAPPRARETQTQVSYRLFF